jgi:hypothetical protein
MLKKNRRVFVVAAAFLALSACGLQVGGVFKANVNLAFIKKSFFGDKTIQVPAGTYNSSVSFDGNNNTVELDLDKVQGKDQTIKFKAPVENMPLDGTWLEIPAAQTGQPYDVRVAVIKDVERETTLRTDYEHCTYRRCHTVCDWVSDGNGHSHKECRDECQTYSGRQYVEYYLVHTDWDVKFKLGKGGSFSSGSFAGKRHDTDRDYVYRGQCH